MLNEKIKELRSQIEAKKAEVNEQIKLAQTRAEAGALEEAKELKAKIDETKSKIIEDEAQLRELEGLAELKPEEIKKVEENSQVEGEERNMPKVKEILKPVDEEVRSFEEFVRTKGEVRAGVTTVDAGAVIPEQIVTTPQQQPEVVVDLRNYVNKVPVTNGSGKYPVLKANKAKMVSVAELASNPELAKPEFIQVNYDIDTYRGYVPVSQESIDDAGTDLAGIVKNHIDRQSLNTSNAEIATVLKSFTAKTVANLDELKKILNVDLNPAYNAKFVVSQSFFNAIDTMKDAQGRYLLQQDITVASGYKLFGREVIIFEDTVIGTTAGDKVAFVGDPNSAVSFFDRKQASVKWVDNDIYGQLLAGFVRFDAVKADSDAGFYVTLAEV